MELSKVIGADLVRIANEHPDMDALTVHQREAIAHTFNNYITMVLKYGHLSTIRRIDFQSQDGIIKIIGLSGKLYKVQRDISAARYVKLLEFEKELQFNRTLTELQTDHETLLNHLRKPDMVESILLADKLARGLRNIGQGRSFVFMMVALFTNADDENIAEVNLDKIDEKVADFAAYSTADLFLCVAIMFPIYLEACNNLSQTIMETAGAGDMV